AGSIPASPVSLAFDAEGNCTNQPECVDLLAKLRAIQAPPRQRMTRRRTAEIDAALTARCWFAHVIDLIRARRFLRAETIDRLRPFRAGLYGRDMPEADAGRRACEGRDAARTARPQGRREAA